MKHFLSFVLLVCALVLVGSPLTHAAVFNAEKSPIITNDVKDDLFTTGDPVLVNAPVFGDLFAAGGTISVRKTVDRSLYVAGSTVTIDEGAGYNAWVAAQTVVIKGEIGHDVWIAAQTVTIDPSARIKGQVRIGAQTVTIAGTVDGKAEITASTVNTSAVYNSDVTLSAEVIEFDGGSIAGNLLYKTPTETSDFGATTITGSKTHEKLNLQTGMNARARSALFGALSMLVSGAVLLFFFRRKVDGVVSLVNSNWVSSLGTGTVVLLLVPVVALMLMITGVGVPLALLTLATYGILLYVAGLLGYVVLGVGIFKTLKQKYQSLWVPFIVALVVMAILQLTPGLNRIAFAAFFVGVFIPTLGATVRWYQKEVVNG